MAESGFDGFLEAGAVHEGEHQDLSVAGVLNDGGDEAFVVEFE